MSVLEFTLLNVLWEHVSMLWLVMLEEINRLQTAVSSKDLYLFCSLVYEGCVD